MNEKFSIIKKKRGLRGAKTAFLDYQIAYLRGELDPKFNGKFTIFTFYNLLDGREPVSCVPNQPGADRHPRELWKTHGPEFLPEFIAENPTERPLPWWQWDCPDAEDTFEALEKAKQRAAWPAQRQRRYLEQHGLLNGDE